MKRRSQDKNTKPIYIEQPKHLIRLLDEEARKEHRSRTAQLARVLEERYGLAQQAPAEESAEVAA